VATKIVIVEAVSMFESFSSVLTASAQSFDNSNIDRLPFLVLCRSRQQQKTQPKKTTGKERRLGILKRLGIFVFLVSGSGIRPCGNLYRKQQQR
jgi:hypothetical protein